MTYTLKCGKCLQDNNVQGGDTVFLWICNNDANENSSSIPCASDGTPISDYTKAKAILSPLQIATALNVVTSVKLPVLNAGAML